MKRSSDSLNQAELTAVYLAADYKHHGETIVHVQSSQLSTMDRELDSEPSNPHTVI